MEIKHISRKKNPADSLSRQLVSDALVRKSSVKDANAEYVQNLRVSDTATNQEIQAALHKLFNQSPQGNSGSQGPQGHSVLTEHPKVQLIQQMNIQTFKA